MPIISVIIPVYNIEAYLKKCIDCVLEQTLRDIEIILVDDGSTDGSGVICDEYSQIDDRIKVIHKVNQGLSCARNDGIKVSSAPYIMFVDGDDWVEPEFCILPYLAARENDADLVYFTYNTTGKNCKTKKMDPKLQPGIVSEKEALMFNVCFTSAVWLGLYNRNLFSDIWFPSGKYYEDMGVSHRLIHAAERICYIDAHLYNYRTNRENSILTTSASRNHSDKSEMNIRRIKDLHSWGYDDFARMLAFSELIQYGSQREEQKYLVSIVRGMKGNTPKVFKKKWKVLYLSFLVSPKLFDAICLVMGKRLK